MAIDAVGKRASVQAYTLGLMRPPPDGSVDSADRAAEAWLYSGLTYALPNPSTTDWFYRFHYWFQVH